MRVLEWMYFGVSLAFLILLLDSYGDALFGSIPQDLFILVSLALVLLYWGTWAFYLRPPMFGRIAFSQIVSFVQITIAAGGAGVLLILISPHRPEGIEDGHVIIYLGILLATVGWITTTQISIRSSKKQHTINTIMQARFNDAYNRHIEIVRDRFPKGVLLTGDDVQELKAESEQIRLKTYPYIGAEPDAEESIRFLANYFEFLCAGILSDDFDERLMKSSLRKILIALVDKFHPFLESARRRPDGGVNSEIYSNLFEIYRRWHDPTVDGPLRAATGR